MHSPRGPAREPAVASSSSSQTEESSAIMQICLLQPPPAAAAGGGGPPPRRRRATRRAWSSGAWRGGARRQLLARGHCHCSRPASPPSRRRHHVTESHLLLPRCRRSATAARAREPTHCPEPPRAGFKSCYELARRASGRAGFRASVGEKGEGAVRWARWQRAVRTRRRRDLTNEGARGGSSGGSH